MTNSRSASESWSRAPRQHGTPRSGGDELLGCATVSGLSPQDLSPLDRRRVAISLVSQGQRHLLLGEGFYASDADLGGVLRVAVQDEAGPLEFVFVEGQWNGTIEPGNDMECDYLMHVG